MGNLHAGHASLVTLAKTRGDRVITSVFVNPLQFGPQEDYAQYPRTPHEDAALFDKTGVDLLFMPTVDEMYPHGQQAVTHVEVPPQLSTILCGEFRPGHFVGVATVVAKLLNIVQPDVAVFGQKDFQQLAVIRQLVLDLCMPVEIVGAPTLREADGLAMSSRNRYLSDNERTVAPVIHASLLAARAKIEKGADVQSVEREGRDALVSAGLRPDYFNVRDAVTLLAPAGTTKSFVILTAAHLGKARLIDNEQFTLP
jgi:pantoate--beta-alanine ligase